MLSQMPSEKTYSVCPVCLREIPASIIESEGRIFFRKQCVEHGAFDLLLSRHPAEYRELRESYAFFMRSGLRQKEYYVCASTACNIDCPVCFLKYCPERPSISREELLRAARDIPDVERFTFSHGEPTVDPELSQKISDLKQLGKLVNLHTNGIKLAEYRYARMLKDAGLDSVSLQFDGLGRDAVGSLRGGDLVAKKQRALETMARLSIPVTLNATIAAGVNDRETGTIFDYAVKKTCIKDLSFITYCLYGPKAEGMDWYLPPEDLLSRLETHTSGMIRRVDILRFQKLFYAYCQAFRKRKCFNYYHYFVVRTRHGYRAAADYIDLAKMAERIDLCRNRAQPVSRWRFIWMLCLSARMRSLTLMTDALRFLLRGGYPRKPGRFLTVTCATICDPYKYDRQVAANCGQGIVTGEGHYESYGAFLIQEMQKVQVER